MKSEHAAILLESADGYRAGATFGRYDFLITAASGYWPWDSRWSFPVLYRGERLVCRVRGATIYPEGDDVAYRAVATPKVGIKRVEEANDA